MLTVAEAAKRLGVGPQLVYQLVATRRIRFCRIGNGRGVIRIPEDAVAEYVSSVTVDAHSGPTTSPASPRRSVKLRHLHL